MASFVLKTFCNSHLLIGILRDIISIISFGTKQEDNQNENRTQTDHW